MSSELINQLEDRSQPRLGDGCYSVTTYRAHLTTSYGEYGSFLIITLCHESAADPSAQDNWFLTCNK